MHRGDFQCSPIITGKRALYAHFSCISTGTDYLFLSKTTTSATFSCLPSYSQPSAPPVQKCTSTCPSIQTHLSVAAKRIAPSRTTSTASHAFHTKDAHQIDLLKATHPVCNRPRDPETPIWSYERQGCW